MKRISFLFPALLLMVGTIVSASAMTGTLVNGEPPVTEITLDAVTTSTSVHDETVDNPLGWYKGWWWVTLTNNTGVAWQKVVIKPGANDLVAIVQGSVLEDENGFIGASVVSNKPGTFAYSGSYGTRNYTFANAGNQTGNLWNQAVFTFATPLASGPTSKVSFKIYTDNSYYDGPWASSFCMCLTPVPVPEPSGLIAISGGLLGLTGMVFRRRR